MLNCVHGNLHAETCFFRIISLHMKEIELQLIHFSSEKKKLPVLHAELFEKMECRERVQETLKEKLRAHYQTKDKIFQPNPKNANTFGVGFFLYMSFVLLGEAFFILLPALYQEQSLWRAVMSAVILFVFVQTMLNWMLSRKKASVVVASMRDKAVQVTGVDAVQTPPGWQTCLKCQLEAPPRSHHCNLCGVCVLKRDHHCFFTASCIGFYNQRRFIVLLFYTTLANITACVLQFLYLDQTMPFLSTEFLNYIPLVTAYRWLIVGDLSTWVMFVVVHLYLTIFCLAGAVFFLVWQFVVVFRGQTSHEAWKNISLYQTGILDGWRSTFGPYGIVHFLFPFQIDLQQDGINWESSKRSKSN